MEDVYDPSLIKIGVQLPEVERRASWDDVRGIAVTVEECGFDSVWTGDHLLYRRDSGAVEGPWEAWTSLAAIAAVTSRVEIASGCVNLFSQSGDDRQIRLDGL